MADVLDDIRAAAFCGEDGARIADYTPALLTRAADEIERLRAEVEALRTMLAQAERDIEEMPVGCGCADDI